MEGEGQGGGVAEESKGNDQGGYIGKGGIRKKTIIRMLRSGRRWIGNGKGHSGVERL